MTPLARVLALPVRGYRLLLSPFLGRNCRFHPTCSAYALEALATHGGLRGARLAVLRIARCHPWGGAGLDEVPPALGQSTRSKKMITSPRSTPNRET